MVKTRRAIRLERRQLLSIIVVSSEMRKAISDLSGRHFSAVVNGPSAMGFTSL